MRVWRGIANPEGHMLPCAIFYLGCLAVLLEFIERAPVWPECPGGLAAQGDH